MVGRPDIETHLAAASPWVRNEFAFLTSVLTSLGCGPRDEVGPGRSFRLDGRVLLRVHPKLRYVALGFPERLRKDVDALTGAVRPQRGAAWLNYAPGVCDRDTIELLIDEAMRSQPERTGTGHTGQPEPPGPTPDTRTAGSMRDDQADLALILNGLRAFRDHERSTGAPSPVKVLRELIFFVWEGPRLPPGRKYSPHLPHSPAARARRLNGTHVGLVFEHVEPISLVIRRLLDDLPADEAALRTALDASSDRVIITKDEDDVLIAAGWRDRAPDPADPWSRYQAIGLDRTSFLPLAASRRG